MSQTFPVKVLPSRIHPTVEDANKLFGIEQAVELRKKNSSDFRQSGLTVALVGPSAELSSIPVYFPLKEQQSEVALTIGESKRAGIKAPICIDPHSCRTPGISVIGPKGSLSLPTGVHVTRRHLSFRPGEKNNPFLREGDMIFVAPSMKKLTNRTIGTRVVIYGEVEVCYSTEIMQGFYIDTEEAAAGNLYDGDQVRLIGKPTAPEFRSDTVVNRKKRLITERDVRNAMLNREKIVVESWMIITPAADELGRSKKVLIRK